MTLETNAFPTYSAIGNREDLTDKIYVISPTDTPFLSMIGKGESQAVLHEWQTDTIDAANSSNAQLEGDGDSAAAVVPTVRLSNTNQISKKIFRVTGTQENVRHAGRVSELAHQAYKATLGVKRDVESVLLRNGAEDTGNTTTARQTGAYNSWVATNVTQATMGFGTGGANGSAGNSARTDASAANCRPLTETMLKLGLANIWESGGDPDCIMVGSFNKQQISTFTGNAMRTVDANDEALYAAIQIYRSDFGDLEVIPNRFQRARDLHIIQKNMWAFCPLTGRSWQMYDLAKTGDSQAKTTLVEYALEARNQASSGGVYDLTSAP